MADKIIDACAGTVDGKTIAVLGLTFKPNTDDMRDAPSLAIVPALIRAGAHVRVFDPEGMAEAKKLLDGVVWCGNAYETVAGADALAVLTEWNEFRALNLSRLKSLMRAPVICDFRNIYNPSQMAAAGFRYSSIGRPATGPSASSDEPTP
jgi:UDPglucose 6-dehydrogenase